MYIWAQKSRTTKFCTVAVIFMGLKHVACFIPFLWHQDFLQIGVPLIYVSICTLVYIKWIVNHDGKV